MAMATATFDCGVVVVLDWTGWLTELRWAVLMRGMMEGKIRRGPVEVVEYRKRGVGERRNYYLPLVRGTLSILLPFGCDNGL